MFRYHLDLARRSFRRHKMLTALMVLAIALGVGASMTTLTVLYLLSRDPLPGKSHMIFRPQLEPRSMHGHTPGEEPEAQLTRHDAEALLRARQADRQVIMTGAGLAIEPQRADLAPFQVDGRATSADFFSMFDVPFRHGGGWSAAEDDARARIAVISRELSNRLFDGQNGVGRTLRVSGHELRIVGVLERWRPTPHFYDLSTGKYDTAEQVFVPFSTSRELRLERNGTMNCWGDTGGDPEGAGAPCAWIQMWVELRTRQQAAAYRDFLVRYSDEQRALGRFQRPTNVRLRSLPEWLEHERVVPGDVRLQTWLAFGFLLVCLLNTVGLLLAKFLRRSGELGVRRALGASRRDIFAQLLVEAGVVGLAGGVLGLALAWLGLWAVRRQPVEYAALARLDPTMLATTFALALVASLLAGLLPAWRACQVTPAMQLRSQ
jgi:putative ABC transport system permease protein